MTPPALLAALEKLMALFTDTDLAFWGIPPDVVDRLRAAVAKPACALAIAQLRDAILSAQTSDARALLILSNADGTPQLDEEGWGIATMTTTGAPGERWLPYLPASDSDSLKRQRDVAQMSDRQWRGWARGILRVLPDNQATDADLRRSLRSLIPTPAETEALRALVELDDEGWLGARLSRLTKALPEDVKARLRGPAATDAQPREQFPKRSCSTCRYGQDGPEPDGCSASCWEPDLADWEPRP